jgi:hypothetical protein
MRFFPSVRAETKLEISPESARCLGLRTEQSQFATLSTLTISLPRNAVEHDRHHRPLQENENSQNGCRWNEPANQEEKRRCHARNPMR